MQGVSCQYRRAAGLGQLAAWAPRGPEVCFAQLQEEFVSERRQVPGRSGAHLHQGPGAPRPLQGSVCQEQPHGLLPARARSRDLREVLGRRDGLERGNKDGPWRKA